MSKTVTVAAALVAVAFAAAARADDGACENLGRIGTMLGQIDSQCPGYGLTAAGQKLRFEMAARIVPIGGEACAEKGKAAMLRDLGEVNPGIEAAARSGDTKRFRRVLCSTIANYLDGLGLSSGRGAFIRRAP